MASEKELTFFCGLNVTRVSAAPQERQPFHFESHFYAAGLQSPRGEKDPLGT
jgi:hypothetical protein